MVDMSQLFAGVYVYKALDHEEKVFPWQIDLW